MTPPWHRLSKKTMNEQNPELNYVIQWFSHSLVSAHSKSIADLNSRDSCVNFSYIYIHIYCSVNQSYNPTVGPGQSAEAPASPGMTLDAEGTEIENRQMGEELNLQRNQRALCIPGMRGMRRSLSAAKEVRIILIVYWRQTKGVYLKMKPSCWMPTPTCSHWDKALGLGFLIRVVFCYDLMILFFPPAFPRCQTPVYLSIQCAWLLTHITSRILESFYGLCTCVCLF